MDKLKLKTLIDAAAGRKPCSKVFKNCRIIDVFGHRIIEGNVGIFEDYIVGIGDYEGVEEIDLKGKYLSPGFIDGHIHIESSYLSPEELGSLLVPCGTTTIIADPHEIVNVNGLAGLDYMIDASYNTKLDIKFMIPSCVPATPFENAGAVINAEDMIEHINKEEILGLGEFMNFPGIINGDPMVIDKLNLAIKNGKLIDGHSPGVTGKDLNAYILPGINTEHECSTADEMHERLSKGMYILLREGSACHELRLLIKEVTEENSRRCLFCSDDRQPKTILEEGHIDNHLRISVESGIDPITAIQMASLNAAECFKLHNKGAIAPGYKADLVVLEDLNKFKVEQVYINGEKVAEKGKYLFEIEKVNSDIVRSSFNVKDFTIDKLQLKIPSGKANIIEIQPGGVVTKRVVEEVNIDENKEFIYSEDRDILKVAVVERHKGTGNVATGLLKGYGLKNGAVALSIAHDSHNIIVVGANDKDMYFAVNELVKQNGGIIVVDKEKVIGSMPMPLGGIMSDKSGEWVDKKLSEIHDIAYDNLKINKDVEPIMTLCFMSLAVIPEVKLTDKGLFDVGKFDFIDVEVQ
ncbi:adenine deaminase [Miniphocaeibacter halophilus]|uniref:Adenine deaminase n=1 Tax=Miniphocaeibacter halophilus TaxID=2931922 RepID=A0AC61MQS8_9FIRM|nr:adenine deaminase [Miniphocaeibacter halophilus]QQK07304.1 adenine deaminase [Miniphocaeibacter halophilus]